MSYANATALTVKEIQRAGLDISGALQSPDGTNGNKFPNDGRTFLRVKNGSGSPITATVETPGSIDGQSISDLAVSIPATTGDKLIGPFTGNFHQSGTSDVFVTYSAVTNVTVDVYRLKNE